jgi:hypothetical protein
MARSSRYSYTRENASKGHKKMALILREIFKLNKIYEEYPYDLILKRGYDIQNIPQNNQDNLMIKTSRKYRADFCILDMGIIVEFLGEHHFESVGYGKGDDGEEERFQHRKHLDMVKRTIARESGFSLIEWPYFEDLTKESFLKKLDS